MTISPQKEDSPSKQEEDATDKKPMLAVFKKKLIQNTFGIDVSEPEPF